MCVYLPGGDAAGGQRLQRVSVAQHLLLRHFIQNVLAEDAGQTELPATYQTDHQVHQVLQNVFSQLHQTGAHTIKF